MLMDVTAYLRITLILEPLSFWDFLFTFYDLFPTIKAEWAKHAECAQTEGLGELHLLFHFHECLSFSFSPHYLVLSWRCSDLG